MSAVTIETLTTPDLTRLHSFRITDELIELHGIRRVTDREARLDCGILAKTVSDLSGVVYPIFGADDTIKGYRVRRDNPEETEKGKKKNKWIMSVDRPHLYFERTSRQYISDLSVPLIVVESYTAALAIAAWCQRTGQHYMVVATAGCWGWSGTVGIKENERGQRVQEKGLSPDFALIAKERTVFILFDSNVSSNYKVRSARRRLTEELDEFQAMIRWPVIPQDDGVNGPDDYLAIYSDKEFAAILDKAKTAAKYETPFKLNDDGVLCRIEKKDKDTDEKETSWVRICSYLDVDAETRDDRGENWGRLLVVKDRDGSQHKWAMPMSMLAGDGTGYREELLSLGLDIAPGRFAKDQLHQYISTARPDWKARCVSRIGWHRTTSGLVYVLPDTTFGESIGGERVLFQSGGTEKHPYQVAGTLKDWQDNLALYCVGNSRLAFAMSLAFAPPLMELAGEPGGGFHYRGPSSTGKTTALHTAGSVWGGGGIEGYIKTWRATSNGLEAIAAQHNHALLCLDELSQVDSRDAGETAYMLANGAGKRRAGRDGSSRSAAEWRLLFLSTGEISLADKMNETGRQVRAGQEVRLVDIPSDAGCSLGIFENIHGLPNADLFARTLRDNALKYYGLPIRTFLEKLTAKPEHIPDPIAKARAKFVNDHVPKNASGQVTRVANRFALIAAAGTLATALGILPWPTNEAVNAAAHCFRSWLEQRGTSGDQEAIVAIQQVRRFFQLHGSSRFADWDADGDGDSNRPTINRAGFRRKDDLGGLEYFVFPEVFRKEICYGLDPKFVRKELITRKYLVPGNDGKPCPSHRLPGTSEPSRVYHFTSAILEGDSE